MNENRNEASDIIKPIEKNVIHKICSGQVILSLSIAVKELVENSLDAGATNIEVRLKEYGSELIEVSDNGSGVLKENFQTLTLKHYTSKIKAFDDLENLCTLGFRGEALSSLCALSDITITTRHKSSDIASKILYDHNGKIINESIVAREPGMTVTMENLFKSLPVRRKEFIKNLKREYNKMCQLLYAYCLVCKGVKFICTNITSKGSKNTIVSTEGLNTIRENIINVFGNKQISTLIEIDIVLPNEDILKEYNITLESLDELTFRFEFYISSVLHGCGRSTTDRQFYYINNRPCEPQKVMKLVNDLYRQFNCNQYPFVYLNIITVGSLVDVNVTPDKRQVFLEKEKYLLAVLKSSLLDAFKNFPSLIQSSQNNTLMKMLNVNSTSKNGKKRILNDKSLLNETLNSFRKKPKLSTDSQDRLENNTKEAELETLTCELRKRSISEKITDVNKLELSNIEIKAPNLQSFDEDNIVNASRRPKDNTLPNVTVSLDSPVNRSFSKKKILYNISLESIKQSLEKISNKAVKENSMRVRFRSEISPDSNLQAEEELQKNFSKDNFKEMNIVGQFNLGFILATLKNDLFIIDQHATDEKYNFEQLQETTTLQNQILVNPKPLELTAGNEQLLIENQEIFKKNGFSFKIDETASASKKISLTAIPISKTWVFGKDDIDEMLFMLQDSSLTMCRPSRVRAMLASRACRMSVMIGKSLSRNEMRKLIDHMGEIGQPWNCPHGRPTMRHLINLDLIQ